MIITNAKYYQTVDTNDIVKATINGVDSNVPMDTNNSDYAEILKQVNDGYMLKDNDVRQYLTIAEAD
tara:strand:- start:25 stop:225 length:201 start_codon:yes stop_codon:yes gene_type:complete